MLSEMMTSQKYVAFTYDTHCLSEYGEKELEQLMEAVRNVLQEDAETMDIPLEEPNKLIYIVLNELKLASGSFKAKINEYCLSSEENRELRLQIYQIIGDVCLNTFRQYCHKAEVLDKRGVYTRNANDCRVRTDMALEINKLIDVFAIRHAVHKLQKMQKMQFTLGAYDPPMKHQYKSRKSETWCVWGDVMKQKTFVKKMFQRFYSQYGSTNPGKLYADFCKCRFGNISRSDAPLHGEKWLKKDQAGLPDRLKRMAPRTQLPPIQPKKIFSGVKPSSSEQKLCSGESFFEDVEIDESVEPRLTQSLTNMHFRCEETHRKTYDSSNIREDVRRLARRDYVKAEVPELLLDDLPAVIKGSTGDDRRLAAKTKLKEKQLLLQAMQRRRLRRRVIPITEPLFIQPDTVTVNYIKKDTLRLSSNRVTERGIKVPPPLQMFRPPYNELIDELPRNLNKQLDSETEKRRQLAEMYDLLMFAYSDTVIPLKFRDQIEHQVQLENLNLSSAINSTMVRVSKSPHINPELVAFTDPPWGRTKRTVWEKVPEAPRKHNKYLIKPRKPVVSVLPLPAEKGADEKTLAEWHDWWKTVFTVHDFLKFINTYDNDFLHSVFHLFPKDKVSPDDHLVGKIPDITVREGAEELQAAETGRKITDIRVRKNKYNEGFWNSDTVKLGGLGRDPAGLVLDGEARGRSRPTGRDTLTSRRSKSADSRDGGASKKRSKKTTETIADLMKDKSLKPGTRTRIRGKRVIISPSGEVMSAPTSPVLSDDGSSDGGRALIEDGLALRFRKVWDALEMSESLRQLMALRHSSNQSQFWINEMLAAWEVTLKHIIGRELLMVRLEKFERTASDPNRFFVKVPGGSGALRLREERERREINKEIDALEKKIIPLIKYIGEKYDEVVTFRDRCYLDKMRHDRTEMLFYLQEERKVNAIHYEAALLGIPIMCQGPEQPATPPSQNCAPDDEDNDNHDDD